MEEKIVAQETGDPASVAGKKPYVKPQLRSLCVAGGTQAKATQFPSEASTTNGGTGPS